MLISTLSIAPMIDWTTSPFRVLMRLIAPHALVYTDMQTSGALLHHSRRALYYEKCEHPIALQLGGSNPSELALCAKMAQDAGYDEVNLNLGCPSDKVQAGRFGACLMASPQQVADCIGQMKAVTTIPVTAKLRIGIDKTDSYEHFSQFAHVLVNAGCDKLIIHARKAWLSGLNPKQNRTIPPIQYDFVYRLKAELPSIPLVINGDIAHLDGIKQHMQQVDGVMLGRLACNNPYALASIAHYLNPHSALKNRSEIIEAYLSFLIPQVTSGAPFSLLVKPLLNMAHGLKDAKCWKEKIILAQQTQTIAPLLSAQAWMKEQESNAVRGTDDCC